MLMSVIASYLMGQNTKLSLDEFGRATVTKRYLVVTNSDLDFEYTVAIQSTSALPDPVPHILVNALDDPGLAQYNGDHGAGEITGTTDETTWLIKKEITRVLNDETDRRKWYVDCTWGPLPLGYAGGLGTAGTGGTRVIPRANALNDPVIERSEYEHYRRRVEYDINGSAIANSAGDPLPAYVDDIRPVLVFVKNKATTAEIDALSAAYKNATNSDVWRGHAIGSLKIVSITKGHLQERFNPATRTGVQFIPMIVRMHKAEKSVGSLGTDQTWNLQLADRGAQILEGYTTGTGTAAVSGTHKVWPKVTAGTSRRGEFLDIVNLNSDGSRQADGQTPNKKTFNIYYPLPFSGLGLT